MTLLIVGEYLRMGGRERRMVELIKGISQSTEDIKIHVVLFPQNFSFSELFNLDIQIHFITFENNVQLLRQYNNIISIVNPNVVQTWTLKTSFYFALLKLKKPYRLIASYIADCFGIKRFGDKLQGEVVN